MVVACFQTGAQNSLHMHKYYGSVPSDLWYGSGKVLGVTQLKASLSEWQRELI